jgi:hypothetical protein
MEDLTPTQLEAISHKVLTAAKQVEVIKGLNDIPPEWFPLLFIAYLKTDLVMDDDQQDPLFL